MAKDYYDILGVSKTATKDEIKKAFRKKAHEFHPDKSTGDEKKFKEASEAYQVLSNDQKRSQYDRFGQSFNGAGAGGQGFAGFEDAFRRGGGGSSRVDFDFGDLGDIFGDFFGGGSRQSGGRASTRGRDIQVHVRVSFREAIFGGEKEIALERNSVCGACGGKGAEKGSKVIKCIRCGGSGQIVKSVGFGMGFSSTCPECRGMGEKYEKDCRECRGTGVKKEKKTLRVKIPAGIDSGQTIRLSGEGEAGLYGSPAGDLFITVAVDDDPNFIRKGYDIHTKESISFSQAALGDKISIETLDGSIKLKVPEGTQSGTKIRLRGRGVPHLGGRARGDHVVEAQIETPKRLTRKQKKILQDLQDEGL